MTDDNIEKIRKDAVTEIKEKVKKNPGYLHPCNKERQEDMKMLKFTNGNDFTHWMQRNRIMKDSTDVQRLDHKKMIDNAECKNWKEYMDKCARNTGFKDRAERRNNDEWEKGKRLPKEFNEYCSLWFGEFISENYVMKTFEDPIKMPQNNRGFDWICKKGEKIEHKGACLYYDERCDYSSWLFNIKLNNIADRFILSAWDNRDSLTPLHVWEFNSNDIVRGHPFWFRHKFTITNSQECLAQLEKYEVTNRLEKLKELCDKHMILPSTIQ